jgi:3'-5' exonuclease
MWTGITGKDASVRLQIYCESDVLNTYRVWLRYELFRGGLSYEGFRRSEDNLMQFIAVRGNTKPHLSDMI